MSALAESDRADAATGRATVAESQVRRGNYLAALDDRLAASLDEEQTEETIAQVALPERDAWAIVDLATRDGKALRLAIVHPDPAKRPVTITLNEQWVPAAGDPIGLPAAQRAGEPIAITDGADRAMKAAAHTPEIAALLRTLGFAACLVVPIRTESEIDGAITFVSARPRASYTPEEVALAQRIAQASAHALRNARLFGAVDQRRSVAESSNRSRTDALGHVTHELRTPLNAIGGYAEILQLGLHGPLTAAQAKDIERIRWNQAHLLGLITDILNFVRVDSRRVEYTITDVDLFLVTREAMAMIEPLFAEKGQCVVVEECVMATLMARADVERARQIAINLLTNANKYAPASSLVTVRCGSTTGGVFMEVTDEGPGIPDDQVEAIFEPFVQLADGETSREGGVGLGLAIARQLARGMRGELTVRSTPGSGSTFRLTLPAAITRAEPGPNLTPDVLPITP